MATIPPLSIVSAASELVVTVAVLYVIWRAYAHNDLRAALLAVVLAFELFVNISYMAYRLVVPGRAHSEVPGWVTAFQGAHGALSLVMFVGLIVLAGMAYALRRDGRNFFREAPGLTLTFVVLWLLSVASGEAIFVATYLA